MKVRFTVPGEPFGKQRPKFSTAHGFGRAYTPSKTVSYENLVKTVYTDECGIRFPDEELAVDIQAYFSIPKSASKKK